jgi:glutaredoxin 3
VRVLKFTVYSTTTCPYCKMLKDYLDQRKVEYEEKLVDQEDSAKEEMLSASGGFLGVPFSVVHKSDGSQDTIIGFDKNKVDELLGS